MKKQEIKYEDALLQLEEIVEKMETGQLGVDELAEQLKQAQELAALCRKRLEKADAEIKKIITD